MVTTSEWKIPPGAQPRASNYAYDLERALSSVVALSARIPSEAFTAETLGTERAGNGVLIREDGLVLTIGYLVTEASSVWLTTNEGRAVAGHVVSYDAVTGLGLVQALGRLDIPALPIGRSSDLKVGDDVVVAGAGGRQRAVAGTLVARQEFAGYWEYALDEALFTAPSHPHWGGTALIGADGTLRGIGSLQLQQGGEREARNINMVVPIDLLAPILDDMLLRGRADRAPRPWLGLYATDMDDEVVVMGLSGSGPAEQADVRPGDVVVAVGDAEVDDLADFFRSVWALGSAGVEVPLTLRRDGRTVKLAVTSVDRDCCLMAPSLH